MKHYGILLITSMMILLLSSIAMCDAVDTSNLVFVVMKSKPVSGEPLITLNFRQNDEIVAVRQYQSGKMLKSEGKIPDGPVLEL